MAIDFTLSNEQRELQASARHFAENVLAPVVRAADDEPDPLRAFQMTKDAYVAAYKGGIAFCMLPKEYGGGGLSNVDLIIAAEEICAVDPGFACTVLVNGLGLLPVWYYGTEEQKDRFLRTATSDQTGEFVRKVHDDACNIFGTVLGPEANDAHKDHFHLDMKKRRRSALCE